MLKLASVTQIANIYTEKGSDLTYKDLKVECIVRGMPFGEVISGDFFRLSNWLNSRILVKPNQDLLEEYDNWLDNTLLQMGKPELVHNSLRLGYVKRDDEDEDKPKPVKVIREKKAPREKDEKGLYKGTMKSYTFELQSRGKTLEQVMVKVQRKFPGAKDKSIKIWFNKSKKLNKQNT